MECNKDDEADRAVQIALKKFQENDQPGAKRSAQKAQAMFSELEGIQHTNPSKSKTVSAPHPDTFWTQCSHCKYKFEYERIYVNTKLMCHISECNKLFSATEMSPPQGSKKTGKEESASQKRQKSNQYPAFETPQVPPFTTETIGAPIPETTDAEHGEKDESLKEAAEYIFSRDISYHRNGKSSATRLLNETGPSGTLSTKRCKNGTERVKVPSGEEEPKGSESFSVKNEGKCHP